MAPLLRIYEQLFTAYGPQGWWPADSPLEVMLGAILVQNTNWRNASKAIDRLREEDAIAINVLAELHIDELAELVRPSGYFRQKARRIAGLVAHIEQHHSGDVAAMLGQDTFTLREELLSLHGIGPETADSIVLYAAGRPLFVVDKYTYRILARHGWIEPGLNYFELQEYCTSQLPDELSLLQELHALLVRVGNQHCGTQPRCDGCPLEALLPLSGPCEID